MSGVLQSVVGASFTSATPEPLPVVADLSLTFYENRNGAEIGSVDVYVVDTEGNIQGSSAYSASGDLGDVWNLRTAAAIGVPDTFRVAWHYVSGNSFTGDYAIDTVNLQGQSFNFDSDNDGFITTSGLDTTSSTSALSNAISVPTTTSPTLGQWNRNSGGTSSSSTGPSGAESGSFYLYTETTSPNNSPVNFWLFSPEITVPFAAFLGTASNLSSSSTQTFSGLSIGSADPNRWIICTVHDGNGDATASLSIGGVSATQAVTQGTSFQTCHIFYAKVPTGTTADFVVTSDSSEKSIGFWRVVTPAANPIADSASYPEGGSNATVTIPPGGIAIATSCVDNSTVSIDVGTERFNFDAGTNEDVCGNDTIITGEEGVTTFNGINSDALAVVAIDPS